MKHKLKIISKRKSIKDYRDRVLLFKALDRALYDLISDIKSGKIKPNKGLECL